MLAEQDINTMTDAKSPKRALEAAPEEPAAKRIQLDSGVPVDSPDGANGVNGAQSASPKLTKEQREAERLAKKKQREEEKLRREAEKQRREEEREEKRKAREAEKQKKEEEKRKKEEEKRKKEEEKRKKEEEKRKQEEEKRRKEEAQQPKIASFFSITSKKKQESPSKENAVQDKFDSIFLPFHVKPNCTLQPLHRFSNSSSDEETIRRDLDARLDDTGGQQSDLLDWLRKNKVKRGYSPNITVPQIIDMLTLGQSSQEEIYELLTRVPQKHLQFNEDIRPPYVGTFSKVQCWFPTEPCTRAVSSYNYDYSSEAEWVEGEEDGEGEDILDDDDSDDSMDDDDDDDMTEFLDESNSDGSNRPALVGPLVPIVKFNDGQDPLFHSFPVEVLGVIDGPIDPYKDYWSTPSSDSNGFQTILKGAAEKKRKVVPEDGIKPLLEKISGQDANQILLIEVLKKDFPQYSKEAIRNTVKDCARRVGDKEKRWEIVPEMKQKYGIAI
uniref:ARAD1B23562p n=1 Tax=Blastobotrys adeninivorans TaxID=409370 RepID=A0A060T7X0_BLAAD